MDVGMQNPDQNLKELEIEYIQAMSDSEDITLQASSRVSEHAAPIPMKSNSAMQPPQTSQYLGVKQDNKDSNFTSFGAPSAAGDQKSKEEKLKTKILDQQSARLTQSIEKFPSQGGLLNRMRSDPKLPQSSHKANRGQQQSKIQVNNLTSPKAAEKLIHQESEVHSARPQNNHQQ